MSINEIKELCIAGACQRGVCYIGCLEKLEELNILKREKLEKVIGVSMGSFIALGYLIGFTPNDFLEIVIKTNTSLFKDIELINNGVALLRGIEFRKWVWDSLSLKIDPNTTFSELYKKIPVNFLILSTCIEDGIVVFSHEKTPDVSIYDACIASMNFPYVFPPFIINEKRYVDGGVINNFPMEMLGPNALGLRVSHEAVEDITSIFTYTGKLFELIVQHMRKLTPPNSKNIVVVDASDFSLLDFDMTIDDKITLYRRGYDTIHESDIIKQMMTKIEEEEEEVVEEEEEDKIVEKVEKVEKVNRLVRRNSI